MKTTAKILTLISFLLLNSVPTFASIIYVDLNANGTNNGSTWANAYEDLQDALGVAISGDEIWVANGVYKPTSTNDRDISFVIPDGISLYGGFAGGEAFREYRNWNDNPTTLSGAIGSQVSVLDNTKILLDFNNLSDPVIIDGFKIQRAYNETGIGNITMIYCDDVTLTNCDIRIHSAPAGYVMYINDTNLETTECLFRDNDGAGGIIGTFSTANASFKSCTFSQNSGLRMFKNFGSGYLDLFNVISYGNTTTNPPENVNVAKFSILQDGSTGMNNTTSVLSQDPMFENPASNNFRLLPGSPAIDFGTNSYIESKFDLQHGLRVFGDQIDPGCYEFRSPSILRVKQTANGLGNGSTWANAFNKLSEALFYSEDGDEIWVASGAYRPTDNTNRSISFVVDKAISIYGGFNGTETFLESRDWNSNLTYLTGDIGVQLDNTDNSKQLLSFSNITGTAIFDGFKLEKAYNDEALHSFVFASSDVVQIRNCEFRDNVSGLGLTYFNNVVVSFESCLFRDNESVSSTLYGASTSSVFVYNCTFSQNIANRIFQTNTTLEVYNSISFGNTTTLNEDATHAENCILEGGSSGIPTFFNVIDDDPLFFNPNANIFKLQEFSPAIGFGNNIFALTPKDLAFEERILKLNVDLGAYESVYQRLGCLDVEACNYDPVAEVDNGECDYPGCTDPVACNYASWASCDDGLCAYDACADPAACNYNTGDLICTDNSLCTYEGCTDPSANNYNPNAGCDDGSCAYGSVIIYVDWTSDEGNEDGTSWDNAFINLQDALDAAQDGDEIWIADGIYKPTTGTNRFIHFDLLTGVKIYGGFQGNEELRSQRNWDSHETIISGEIGTVSSTDNSILLFQAYNLNEEIIMDGLIFQDAYATTADAGNKGTIWLQTTDIVIRNCHFRNCTNYTAAVVLQYGILTNYMIVENILAENCYSQQGMMISTVGGGGFSVIGSTFANIDAGNGLPNALLYSTSPDSEIDVYNSIFYNIDSDNFVNSNPLTTAKYNLSDIAVNNVNVQSNNIVDDPMFVDSNNDFRLTAGSPALEAGFDLYTTQDFDLNHNQRIQSSDIDMGCYEGSATLFTCMGDANYDGYVNIVDLLAVSSAFGCNFNCTFGDSDGNGVVNITDLLVVSSNFGLVCAGN